MSLLGNVIWFVFGGLLMGLGYLFMGLLYCLTIIGMPLGFQLIKIGVFAMLPFGREPVFSSSMGCLNLVLNIIWIFFGGIELAVGHLLLGAIFCLTIIGIPFGMQHFKLAKIALLPFGQSVR